jgi:hypothetical protein
MLTLLVKRQPTGPLDGQRAEELRLLQHGAAAAERNTHHTA